MDNIIRAVLATLFMLFFGGFCVFIHELGHFLVARWRGLHIVAFSIGFKKAWGKKINGVEYRIGWLPFGGYVDLPQIDTTKEEIKTEDGQVLPPAKPIDRILTAFAGPFFNVLFGLALGCIVWVYGVPQNSPKMKEITVEAIDTTSPEYKAGLRLNDKIFKINGSKFDCTWEDFVQKVMFTIGAVDLEVKRGDKTLDIKYVPKENVSANTPSSLKQERVAYPFFLPRIPITLYPEAGMPAAKAGIKPGDILLSVGNINIYNIETFQLILNASKGKELMLTILRGDEKLKIPVKPELNQNLPEEIRERYMIGITYDLSSTEMKITSVTPGFPAQLAGIKTNDVLIALNGKKLTNGKEFKELFEKFKTKPIVFTVKRGDKTMDITVEAIKVGHYTIGASQAAIDYPDPIQQFVKVLELSYKSLRSLSYGLSKQFGITETGSTIKPRNLSGPLGMGRVIYLSVYNGTLRHGIFFIVLISFALAIFNLLPLPVLDGGHIAMAAVEMVIRRPLHRKTVEFINITFVVLLIGLMIYVTFFDIMRFIPQEPQKVDLKNWIFLPGAQPELNSGNENGTNGQKAENSNQAPEKAETTAQPEKDNKAADAKQPSDKNR